MPFDQRYVAAFNIEEILINKDTGQPLSGGIVTFEQSNQPGTLKPVYRVTYASGTYTYIQLPNPMTLSSVGTFVDSLGDPVIPYFLPYDGSDEPEFYRVKVESAGLVPQFVRDPVPSLPESGDMPTGNSGAYENEISNPQFAEVYFDTNTVPFVYTFTGGNSVVNIAPDWDLVVTGSGTVSLTQVTPTGSSNVPTNPGTILKVQSAGLTSVHLRQRIYGSPNLWGNGNLATSVTGKSNGGAPYTMNMYYSQSAGTPVDFLIYARELPTTGYATLSDTATIATSTNPDEFPDGYIEIYLDINTADELEFTSIMVAFTGDTIISDIGYNQESNNRQIDNLFHDFKDLLVQKRIPSVLTGWDFGLNPAQFSGTSHTLTTTFAYTWDQTICRRFAANVTMTRPAVSGGINFVTTAPNETIFMMQYLSGSQVTELQQQDLSINIEAYTAGATSVVTARAYIMLAPAAGVFGDITLGTVPFTPGADGTISTPAANWVILTQENGALNRGTLVNATTDEQIYNTPDLKLTGWKQTAVTTPDKLAVIISFVVPTTGTQIQIQSISLNKGKLPTRPAPQTPDQVLRECQYYYEKSYNPTEYAGAVTAANAVYTLNELEAGGTYPKEDFYLQSIWYNFRQAKRTIPAIDYYSPTGLKNFIQGRMLRNNVLLTVTGANPADFAIGIWDASNSNTGVRLACLQTSTLRMTSSGVSNPGDEGQMRFHYIADARLGIV